MYRIRIIIICLLLHSYLCTIGQKFVVDTNFARGSGFDVFPNIYTSNAAQLLAKLNDGKVVAGKIENSSYNGRAVNSLIKIDQYGQLDSTFQQPYFNNKLINSFIVQNDKIVIGGNFNFYTNDTNKLIARINVDGKVDTTFASLFQSSGQVNNIHPLTNGQYILTGLFNKYSNIVVNNIIRINQYGSFDTTFDTKQDVIKQRPCSDCNWYVVKSCIEKNGKLILSVYMKDKTNDITTGWLLRLFRLNTDGTIDTTFAAPVISTPNTVQTGSSGDMIILKNNKILLSNYYNLLLRIDEAGNIDTAIRPDLMGYSLSANRMARKIIEQPDGKLIIAGNFDSVFPNHKRDIIRLNEDLSLDTAFYIETNNFGVHDMLFDTDTSIIITGTFTRVFGVERNGIARVLIDPCSRTPLSQRHKVIMCRNNIAALNSRPQARQSNWSTGDTTHSITPLASGTYWVHSFDGYCHKTDTFDVQINEPLPPMSNMPRKLCKLQPFNVQLNTAYTYYQWGTGDTTSHLWIPATGMYSIIASDSVCTVYDTLDVVILHQSPQLTDTLLCKQPEITIKSRPAERYQWNTGDTTQQIIIQQAGHYKVQRSIDLCELTDSFSIKFFTLPQITSVTDTTVCFDEVKQILLDAGQFAKYLWEPTGETTRTIYSNTAQVYKLTVTDSNTCVSSKDFAVMEECPYSLYIPNAFTPNSDGTNDVLVIKGNRIDSFRMMVINRWGQIVFETTRMDDYWTAQGCTNDVYTLIIEYSALGKTKTYKGNVTVLR